MRPVCDSCQESIEERKREGLAAVLAAEQQNAEAALGLAYTPKLAWARCA